YQKQSLSQVLSDLSKKHKLNFSYSNNEIALNKVITVNVKNKALSTVLDQIAEKCELVWQQLGNQIILKAKPKTTSQTSGQILFQTVRGVVVDKESNFPVPGVTVRIISLNPVKGDNTNVQ